MSTVRVVGVAVNSQGQPREWHQDVVGVDPQAAIIEAVFHVRKTLQEGEQILLQTLGSYEIPPFAEDENALMIFDKKKPSLVEGGRVHPNSSR